MSDMFAADIQADGYAKPLAARMRPSTLGDFVGQEKLLAEHSVLRVAIEQDQITSAIFWGPPGCGKSTLANIIAHSTKRYFANFSAVTSGIPEMRKVIQTAKERLRVTGQHTILFIDEIHRFNKAQQDALLPHVEDGTVTLIGATTENPYFEVNSPLLSRARIIRFEQLNEIDVRNLAQRALNDPEHGLGRDNVTLDPDALDHIVDIANGDARQGYNILELAAQIAPVEVGTGIKRVTVDLVEQAAQQRVLNYDKNGDNHYDIISAFIKSMRGSDPDAAVYWLARMLSAGEDPKFVARRIVIQASEDVGNADPMALVIATAAANAVQFVGMPEAQIPLAQAAIYLACAPKSNASYKAINKANADVAQKRAAPVPAYLRDANYPGAKALGHGIGYKYPHDYPGNHVPQDYVPTDACLGPYYEPTENGHEAKFKQRLQRLRGVKPIDTGISSADNSDKPP